MASTQFRMEHDFLGDREVPADAYYGVQTLGGRENFHITGMPISREPYFVKAFGYVKKAAAMANRDLGVLDAVIADAIIRACDRVIAGEMNEQFVTDFIQGGAGTSTNMNANEVIANLALESLGHKKGEYQHVSPNGHVNFGQSTNDTYPTAFHLGLILRLASYMEALRKLEGAFRAKARELDRVLKMGRTHLQDAVPMSMGAEFNGWATTIGEEVQHIAEVRKLLQGVNLGATAIGTTVTAAPGYPALSVKHLSDITGIEFHLSPDLIEATSNTAMERAVTSLRANCVEGITANAEHTRDMVLNSLGIVTVLKPSLGYKQCAEIAHEGHETGKSLHDIVVKERKLLTQQKWDEVFSFENLINPKFEQ